MIINIKRGESTKSWAVISLKISTYTFLKSGIIVDIGYLTYMFKYN